MTHALAIAISLLGLQQQFPRKASTVNSPLAVKVRVDGELINFRGTSPVMEGSRILVPLRGVFEHLGATLAWDPSTRTVTAKRGEQTIVLPVGRSAATIDGKSVAMDQPAMVIDRRTFVPLRFLSQSLGAKVEWLTADRTVEIRTGDGD